jgi:serine/threonine protein kinase
MASSSSNVVGVHYRVGKKIGEGSFGVIFEGTNLLNNQQVAIKFVCQSSLHTSHLQSSIEPSSIGIVTLAST